MYDQKLHFHISLTSDAKEIMYIKKGKHVASAIDLFCTALFSAVVLTAIAFSNTWGLTSFSHSNFCNPYTNMNAM